MAKVAPASPKKVEPPLSEAKPKKAVATKATAPSVVVSVEKPVKPVSPAKKAVVATVLAAPATDPAKKATTAAKATPTVKATPAVKATVVAKANQAPKTVAKPVATKGLPSQPTAVAKKASSKPDTASPATVLATAPEVPVVGAKSVAKTKATATKAAKVAEKAAKVEVVVPPIRPIIRREVKKVEVIIAVPSVAPAVKYPKIDLEDEFEGIEKLSEAEFVGQQLWLLNRTRDTYLTQSKMLKDEADQLAAEMEPGDVQFDDESGEGASVSMEREKGLAMSEQKAFVAEEIGRAIKRIDDLKYGCCTNCFRPIPRVRLRALAYTTLCIECKNGGLSRPR